MTISTDFYISLLTSEHRDKPQFTAVVQALTQALADGVNLGLSLIDKFDLDQANGAQLDAIGLWVGMLRSVKTPLTGVYFTWDTPQPASAPTLGSSAGGALAAATYYVAITYVFAAGESLGSAEASHAVAANNLLTVQAPANAPTQATGFNVYVSTSAGNETKQNSGVIPLGSTWTEPTSGLIAGAALPASSVGSSLGWEKGSWQGPFDPTTGLINVDNSTYRTLIKAKIAANSWDGTFGSLGTLWDYIFGPGVITVQDNMDMTMVLIYDSLALPAVMTNLLTSGGFPLKPMGVKLNYTGESGAPLFSWNLSTPKFQGWTGESVWGSSGSSSAPPPPPPPPPAPAPSIAVADWDNVILQDSDTFVITNIWGAGSLTRGPYTGISGSTYEQQIGIDSPAKNPGGGATAFRITWKWPTGTTEVKSFPGAIVGNQPGWAAPTWAQPDGMNIILPDGSISTAVPSGKTPNTIFPIALPITGALHADVTYAHAITPSGHGHLSFDIWCQNSPTQGTGLAAPPITVEIMIPVAFWGSPAYGSYPSGRNPAWYSHDATIDGLLWHLYYAPDFNGEWVFIVFEPDQVLPPTHTLDLAALINYAGTQGWLSAGVNPHGATSTHVVSVGLGVEPVDGVGDLTVSNFRVY